MRTPPLLTLFPYTTLFRSILMANLAIRVADIPKPRANGRGNDYPGSNTKLLWDYQNMRVTNYDEANQFVKREYRQGWTDRKSTRLNSSHMSISYAVFCLKK